MPSSTQKLGPHHAYVLARVELRAALLDNDIARDAALAAVQLHSQVLWQWLTAQIGGRASSLLGRAAVPHQRCHIADRQEEILQPCKSAVLHIQEMLQRVHQRNRTPTWQRLCQDAAQGHDSVSYNLSGHAPSVLQARKAVLQ